MSDTVIRVENLGKKYIIGHQQEKQRYTALRDVIAGNLKNIRQYLNPFKSRSLDSVPYSPSKEEFWALKDVSFEIKQGDRVGIIGRNGAGKSTLLKILSRITEPTTGRIELNGRVASLLEVGTGFHPELTGRENIYLNGAILGMSRLEIRRKFDEIVAFAEVEKFLDTPVKRYSSGMYVRLAFAVAAHLEPEILVVDEVLAVGDTQFQKKCLGKMQDVGKEGRTVLFVSHNMAAIQTLCERGIFLIQGRTTGENSIEKAIELYEKNGLIASKNGFSKNLKYFHLHGASIKPKEGITLRTFEPAEVKVDFSGKQQLLYPDTYISIKNLLGQKLAGFKLKDIAETCAVPTEKSLEITFEIQSLPLMPGQYKLCIELKDLGRSKWEFLPDEIDFEVAETPVYGTQRSQVWHGYVGLDVNAISRLKDNKCNYTVDI